jgi:ABC-type multidrug transport system fused ATPase/permease subunit
MRSNLDQFNDYSDAEIWHALEQVISEGIFDEKSYL